MARAWDCKIPNVAGSSPAFSTRAKALIQSPGIDNPGMDPDGIKQLTAGKTAMDMDPRRDSCRNCGMGSANPGLYDVLNNEESESLSGVVHQEMMMEIGEKGVSGETERRDGHRDPGP